MNEYTKKLDLRDSHFENPTGLDAANHYSSAADLTNMARVLLHNQTFRAIVRQPRATAQSLGGTNFSFASTNQLLAYPYIIGLKTGKTEIAGECLITLSTKDGHELITVVLNSPNRFQESKNMVDWAFANTIWK
jgi:D-alanyl-D-alanine carboxypeptidase